MSGSEGSTQIPRTVNTGVVRSYNPIISIIAVLTTRVLA